MDGQSTQHVPEVHASPMTSPPPPPAPRKPKTMLWVLLGCAGCGSVFIFISCLTVLFSDSDRQLRQNTLASKPPRIPTRSGEARPGPAESYAPKNPPAVSAAEFEKVETGMSYAEVVKIVGGEGELQSENKIDAVPGVMDAVVTKMYYWKGDKLLSGMTVIIQNDKVFQKSQMGLN